MKSACRLALAASLIALPGSLPGAAPFQDFQALRAQATAWLEHQALQAYPEARAQVLVGAVDERLRLANCAAPRFFLPANAQLWSQGRLGVRCEGDANWTLYLTYRSRLSGPALVTARPLPARHVPGQGDVELKQVEYTQSPDFYPRALPADSRFNRPVAAGQAVQIGWLALPNVIQAGQKVAITASGTGFSIAQEGTALNSAAPGESVKVKAPSGRIVQGIATRDGRVAIRP